MSVPRDCFIFANSADPDEVSGFVANSEDPDEMPHHALFAKFKKILMT